MLSRKLDFTQICQVDPQLIKYFDEGTGNFKFNEHEAVIKLTQTLIKIDLGYRISLNINQLCPNYFNRLDYITFINKLIRSTLETLYDDDMYLPVYGMDIGTSQSCIYPIIATKYIPGLVKMVGTDIVPEFINASQKNIEMNQLNDKIDVVLVEKDKNLFDSICKYEVNDCICFTICNPPFYSSEAEMIRRNSRKKNRKNTTIGHASELFTDGGDFTFIMNMLQNSKKYSYQITWFTTLIGNHSTLLKLIPYLKLEKVNYGIHRFTSGSFTTRWIIFWTFNLKIKPPYQLFNYTNSKIKNPFYKKVKLNLLSNRLLIIQKLKSMPYLSLLLRGNSVIIKLPGNVFSRSYRRTKFFINDGSIYCFELCMKENVILWKSGFEYKIFESFCDVIKQL